MQSIPLRAIWLCSVILGMTLPIAIVAAGDGDGAAQKQARIHNIVRLRGFPEFDLEFVIVDDDGAPINMAFGGERDGWPDIEVTPTSIDRCIFGRDSTPEQARARLMLLLEHEVDAIDRICMLSEIQRKKLLLAGRGDLQRFFARVERMKRKLSRVTLETSLAEWAEQVAAEIKPLRHIAKSGKFDEDSLFAKVLRTELTTEQASKLRAARYR